MLNEDTEKLVLGLAVVGVTAYFHRPIINTVADVITRGKRLTNAPVDAAGIVRADPGDLASAAMAVYGSNFAEGDYSALDVYALARMSRSEADRSDNNLSRTVRMHVALNDFAEVNWADHLADLFLYSNDQDARGYFGTQTHRRYATTNDPYEGDIRLAIQAIREQANGIDPSAGAVKFVDSAAMGGVQAGTGTWAALVERWEKDGLKPYNIVGLPDQFFVFRRDA